MMATGKALPLETLLPFPERRNTAGSTKTPTSDSREMNTDNSPESGVDDDGSDTDKPARRQKRSRACQACRSMKIRCNPVDGQEACLSCSKVNRPCIMPGPARKRQKTVHKVAELEKKIDALSEALLAKSQYGLTPPTTEVTGYERSTESRSEATVAAAAATPVSGLDTYDRTLIEKGFSTDKPELEFGYPKFPTEPQSSYIDIIDRGLLDMRTATAMFDHWRSNIQQYCPLLAIPEYLKAQDVRAAKPLLFLAVMTIASPMIRPTLHGELLIELNAQLAGRVLYFGEKTIELVQTMLTYTEFYVRARHSRDLVFNQYIHSAVVMSLDLGMGKRAKRAALEGESEEAATVRRTWLGCYKNASSVATLQRYPALVRFSPYIEECLQFFATSPYALPSDKWLCCQINLQRIAEEVSIIFNMDDPASTIAFTDAKTQYHIKTFERQLVSWRESVPDTMDTRLVEHMASSLSLYIHEIAIHQDHNVDDFRIPALGRSYDCTTSENYVTTAHIEALAECMHSCHRIFDSYLALDLPTARSIPNLFIVWNTYAGVALVKLHGLVNDPNSKLGSVFAPELKVEYYLDAMSSMLAEVSSEGHGPAAEAFGFVFKKLKSWFMHRAMPCAEEKAATTDPNEQIASNIIKDLPPITTRPESTNIPESRNGPSDLNTAYDATNYNINWDDVNFSADELKMFDMYMNDAGWLGYLL